MKQTKRCPRCQEVKTAFEFGFDRNKADGLQTGCKACRIKANNQRTFERRRIDPEYRERRAANDRGRDRTEYTLWRRQQQKIVGTPDWSRRQLQKAVARGKIVKPSRCERCDAETPKAKLHGHHWHGDYAGRPLDVEWLCALCHGATHRMEQAS